MFPVCQEAISNGVLEYLLKPVSGDSIRAALDKLDQKLEQDYLRQTMDVQYSRLRYAQQANSLLKYVNGAALTMREQYIIDTAAEQGESAPDIYMGMGCTKNGGYFFQRFAAFLYCGDA